MISSKIHTLFIIIIISAIGVFYLLTIREGHNWGGDFSMYIHHAKNIAEGIDYKDTGYIYNPFYPTLGPKTYPPIFPVLLSPIYKWFGLNLTAMKIEITVMFLIFLIIFFLIFKNELPFSFLVMVIALIGCSPYFWNFKDNVLSDIPFLLWTYISLFLILQAYQSNRSQRIQLLYSVCVGLFIYLSYGTRSIGIVFIPCLFIHDIITHKRPTQFTIIATLIFIFFMALQTVFLHSDRSYFDQATVDPKLILRNILLYGDSLAALWDNGYSRLFTIVFFIVVSALATVGYVTRIKNRVTFLEIFLLLYVGIIIIWPDNEGTRFLIPVIPLYIMYVFIGLTKLTFIRYKETRRLFIAILIVAFFSSYFGKYMKFNYDSIDKGVGKKETIELFEYIKKNTDGGDVFIFRKPRVLSLFTERSAGVYHRPDNYKDLWSFFNRIGATYLIVSSIDPEFLHLFVGKYEDRFEEMYSNVDFKVYKIRYKNENVSPQNGRYAETV